MTILLDRETVRPEELNTSDPPPGWPYIEDGWKNPEEEDRCHYCGETEGVLGDGITRLKPRTCERFHRECHHSYAWNPITDSVQTWLIPIAVTCVLLFAFDCAILMPLCAVLSIAIIVSRPILLTVHSRHGWPDPPGD